MNFVEEEGIKNGLQLKDFLFTACGYNSYIGRIWKKDLPPIALLAKKIMEEKANQTTSQALKRRHEKDRKQKKMMRCLLFQKTS